MAAFVTHPANPEAPGMALLDALDASQAGRAYPHSAGRAPAAGRYRLGFFLFVLVNAVLFVRPAEIVPGWENLPIYQCLILACLVVSLPVVLPQLSWASLRRNPITLCVLGLLVAVVLSQLSHGNTYDAREGATEFSKVVIYYLLLVGLIDSPGRLRLFLLILAGFILCTAALSLLNHHGIINIPALADLHEGAGEDGEEVAGEVVIRLRAMGIFNDPNDFCLILNAAIFICLHWLIEQKGTLVKAAWALPIAPLAYALILTKSRGGFLAFIVGLLVVLFSRMRWKRALCLAALGLPFLFLAGGRQTNLDLENSNDTAQGRILLWRDALVLFHSVPLFGCGYATLADEIGLVAHNSYVHSYAELGLFGGTFFVGAVFLSIWGVRKAALAGLPGDAELSPEMRSLRLCLLPVLAEYAMGIYSLSRCYVNTTYVIFGVAAAFLALAAAQRVPTPQFSKALVRQLVLVSVGCLFFLETFVRIFAR